jgi:hypothetical protein
MLCTKPGSDLLCPPPARFVAIEQDDHLAEVGHELGFLLS